MVRHGTDRYMETTASWVIERLWMDENGTKWENDGSWLEVQFPGKDPEVLGYYSITLLKLRSPIILGNWKLITVTI